ncbi:MAG: hypothetical protein E2598_06110 [Sphingobium sp.]|nr:hypothetical protein [Sphingobium sp.]
MNKTVMVATRQQLLSLDAIEGLADSLNELPIGRREVLNWLADVLHNWIEDGGTVLTEEGKELIIYSGIVDDAHGEDGSGSWISVQRRRKEHSPPQRRPRQSMLLRLQLYDAAFRIAHGRSIFRDTHGASCTAAALMT